jgi:hypothetical protein
MLQFLIHAGVANCTSCGSRGVGSSHVVVQQGTRTVATLLTASKNKPSDFCWRHNELILVWNSTGCIGGLLWRVLEKKFNNATSS